MAFMASLSLLPDLNEAARAIASLVGAIRTSASKNQRKQLIGALRKLYFPPDGIRAILVDLSQGQKPDHAKARKIITSFDASEHPVGEALDMLGYRNVDNLQDVTTGQRRILQEIVWQKTELRAGLIDDLEAAIAPDEPVEPEKAAEMLAAIDQLNLRPEDIEEALL